MSDLSDERSDASPPEPALGELFDRVTHSLEAHRVILWELRPEDDRLVPLRGSAPLPDPREAARSVETGGPLHRALGEGGAVRVDPAPEWAAGPLTAVRVDERRLLTLEAGDGGQVDPERASDAARMLAPVLRLHDQHAAAMAAAERADRLVGLLASLQATAMTGTLPDALLDSALAVGAASGGVVASWIGHEGTVLATAGRDGGPLPGTPFVMGESDLSHSARTGSPVARGPEVEEWPVLASSAERWEGPAPTHRVVIPLIEPGGMTTGMLALWARHPLESQGVSLLQGVAPLLATQLQAASELRRLRARATVDALTGLPNRRGFENRLAEEAARFSRYQRPVSLLVVQIEGLERVADELGRDARDAVLRGAAEAIRAVIRKVDYPARYDEEKLAVLLPETPLGPARDVAERVRSAVGAARPEYGEQRIEVTAAVSVSACPEIVERPEELLESAEQE